MKVSTLHNSPHSFCFSCSGWDEEFLERDALRVVKPAINGDYATSLLSQIQQAGIAARNNRLLRIASKCANRNLINELFKRKASSSSYSSTKDVIDSAVMSKDVDFVKWLLVRFPKLGEDKDESVVDSAIISGSLDMFKYLLEIINASPKDAAVAQNSRLIKLAAGQGSMEIVEFLLIQAHSTGAASFLTPSVTSEILNKAITSGNVKLVRNLLGDDLVRDKHQPQISTTFRITHGSCSAAIKSGKLALVKYFCNAVKSILKQAGISQNAVFNNKLVESSLFFLTDPAILEFLFSLDKSISPDGRMLNRAFFTGNHRVFKFLVEECGVFVPDALLRQAHEHCKQRRRRSGFGGGERVEGEEDFTKGDRLNRERLYTYLCHEY